MVSIRILQQVVVDLQLTESGQTRGSATTPHAFPFPIPLPSPPLYWPQTIVSSAVQYF